MQSCEHRDTPDAPICGQPATGWTIIAGIPRCAVHKDDAGTAPKPDYSAKQQGGQNG